MKTQKENEPVCCPPFDPTLWDDQIFMWEDKLFIKEKVCTFLYMPINFGSAMRRADRLLTQSGSQLSDALCLSDHTSKWNMDVFLSVGKEIPGADNIKISGSFFCKVYEGPFKDTGKWCSDFEAKAKEKGLTVKKMYMWYTTCPKCAKKYGKNYVAIFGQVD
jgi:hypothetical protein